MGCFFTPKQACFIHECALLFTSILLLIKTGTLNGLSGFSRTLSMSKILLFGAGKSATVLIDFLVQQCAEYDFSLEVVDALPEVAHQKIQDSVQRAHVNDANFIGRSFDINDSAKRLASIESADLVLSLLPPHLHAVVALDCIHLSKSLFTASYVDPAIRQHAASIEANGSLFLYEMGLDPGIDHMSLLSLLDAIRLQGGQPIRVLSHCGGLVAPESDDNPWHYKISWNPRNVVMAGKAGAQYLEKGVVIEKNHAQLFSELRTLYLRDVGEFAFYPNRDSLSYIDRYGLQGIESFQRTTLRHPDFIRGWSELIQLGMIDDERTIEWTTPVTLSQALNQCSPLSTETPPDLRAMLEWLGWSDPTTILPFQSATPAQILQFAMEQKWVLHPTDKDQVVMLHEIDYRVGPETKSMRSWLVDTGVDSVRTAMAKTVGLPLGIAAMQFLTGKWKATGLQIPTLPDIYVPVLEELKKQGIAFEESIDQ